MFVSNTDHRYPPGPKGKPFLGNLLEFRRDPLQFLVRLAREYGDVASFRIGSQKIVQISHPDLIKDVLVTNHRNFRKTGVLERARPVLGNGLVTADGEFHRRQRKLMQPALNRQRIASYGTVMTDCAARMSERWRHGETVDVFQEMLHLSLEIVTRALFNIDLESEADEIEKALTIVLEHFNHLLVRPHAKLFSKLPSPSNRRFQRAQEYLDDIVYRMINERRLSREDRGDVLSMLLLAQDEEGDGRGMSDQQIRDEVMTLLTAGHETVASALTWTWYCLSQNPDAEAALHGELDSVLEGRPPTTEDLPELTCTEMVFAETMRLFPPVWGITRRVIDDYEMDSYTIPAGTVIGMTQYVMHHDSRFYTDPYEFDLFRWSPEIRAQRPKYSYFPFGGGPRLCIGEPFAWVEGILAIATLAQHWQMQFVPGHRVTFQPLLTLRPKDGLPMALQRRQPIKRSRTTDMIFSVP